MSLIFSVNYTNNIKIHYYQGTHGKYYRIEELHQEDIDENYSGLPPLPNIAFDIHFPINWVFDEKYFYEDCEPYCTGPHNCKYCRNYGIYKGVFIGYCGRCADQFNCSRGNGFLIAPNQPPGEEIKTYIRNTYHGVVVRDRIKNQSIWQTYLKGVTLNEIGCDNLCKDDNNSNNGKSYDFDYNNYLKEKIEREFKEIDEYNTLLDLEDEEDRRNHYGEYEDDEEYEEERREEEMYSRRFDNNNV